MERLVRIIFATLGLFALCASAAYADDDDYVPGGPPKIASKLAQNVSDTTATLRASVDPNHGDDWSLVGTTTYRFEIGPTNAYGVSTPNGSLQWWQGATTVTAQVSGLTPGTTYHYRAVASNNRGPSSGADTTFKTTGKAPAATASSPKAPKAPESAPEPELGHSVAAHVATGTVMVREQGAPEFHPLGDGESIPVNSTFDTSMGTVLLEAARRNGETYTGTFHGGQFTVHQSTKGTTTLELEGGDFSACGSNRMARATASAVHPMLRKLWGKDHGGRFKTSSRGSVATVRGTEWLTADRCDGTLTRVTKGLVLVRERGTGRSKLLHKGDRFFAHAPN